MKPNLFTTEHIRKKSNELFDLTCRGEGSFRYHPEKWDSVVNYVLEVIKENYPSGNIPFHSRLNHFKPQRVNRLEWLDESLSTLSPLEKVEILFDLVIPSVLLDAGAGTQWCYREEKTGQTHSRSEGLGVASFHLFASKELSHDNTLRTTKTGLQNLTKDSLEKSFQVNSANPLIGVEGRLHLLHSLAAQLDERPGELAKLMFKEGQVDALDVLSVVLEKLGPIWPSQNVWEQRPLGDCWPHPKLGSKESIEQFIPFHKLSQWMSYSLLDCFKLVGIPLKNVDKLTGLPEYRNGGLFLDLGLIEFRSPELKEKTFFVSDPTIIEWRALTIVFLDELARQVQKKIGKTAEEFPLACVLEGGSWAAGRKIAAQLRPDSSPPIHLQLDGTVF